MFVCQQINDQWAALRIMFTHQLLTLLKALAVGHSLGTVKFLEVLLPALLLRCPGVTALLMRAGHCGYTSISWNLGEEVTEVSHAASCRTCSKPHQYFQCLDRLPAANGMALVHIWIVFVFPGLTWENLFPSLLLRLNLILVTFLIEQNGHQREFFLKNILCGEYPVDIQ